MLFFLELYLLRCDLLCPVNVNYIYFWELFPAIRFNLLRRTPVQKDMSPPLRKQGAAGFIFLILKYVKHYSHETIYS